MTPAAFAELEALMRRAHELLLEHNVVRLKAGPTFRGTTKDGRPVRHRFNVEGAEVGKPAAAA